jgi:NAD+ kinase
MIVGIIPNATKNNIIGVTCRLAEKLKEYGFDYIVSDSVLARPDEISGELRNAAFCSNQELSAGCDMIVSIGGDGTMLNAAHFAFLADKPVLGLNYGKLGFLAEMDINSTDSFLDDIKEGRYFIEERMVLEGICLTEGIRKFYAVNDIVIDKGAWKKMVEISVDVDGEYVTTFNADGLVLATPTGSTGYSLSTGGPVVSPKSKVIALSPISPHSLTMRHLILSDTQTLEIAINSPHNTVQLSCDGALNLDLRTPAKILVRKCERYVKLVHTESVSYYSILREKLYWGIDARNKKEC